ncbi:hypothetical protein ACM01_45470 [Streptomyces viridochromogenes]|uniref:Secreted protein n=1 Tax=Streptomyces viridochromogenes TaxID=1938 RepID=A0A0J7YSM5_STRVR|nr:hypothetical protein [Streptomyces viridochromogenes]KMS66681.1 hypothetical protein ACM01_45470 [Streptomyces viridochromogenes]KOG25146.1 hypothetical protein ADK36_05935 [Streptomyces viridochromogenes]KOG25879.1 hypothetical protein ADK35_08205 [Streptomyces viridochromogenes]
MSKHTRTGTLVALAVATLAAGAALTAAPAGAATKAPAPKFLSASQLPPHPSSDWTADKVTDGVPEEMQYCFGEALLAYDSRYRTFRTELETNAQQLNVVVGDSAKAKALATRLDKEAKRCVARMDAAPDVEADYKSYGTLPVEEGARVHGFATRASWGAMDVHLLSVGRDGGTVTVVQWGQMGDFTHAPVKDFRKTTTTAVNKLY